MSKIKKALQVCGAVLFGTAEGTIREPFIEPKEAIRKNKDTIKKLIDKVSAEISKDTSKTPTAR